MQAKALTQDTKKKKTMIEKLCNFYGTKMPKVRDYLMIDFLGGPHLFQLRHIINCQKCPTLLVFSILMYTYDNFSKSAYLITALHGTYGICWWMKELILPDPNWNVYVTIPSAILVLFHLVIGYWSAGYLIISRLGNDNNDYDISPLLMAIAIQLHTLGVVLMLCTDTQKFFVLKLRQGLIDDGWLSRSRNTNYLGEIMIYLTYCILAQHWFPWMYNGLMWITLFATNMAEKDLSLKKKVGGDAYMKRSGLLFPNLLFSFSSASPEVDEIKIDNNPLYGTV